jgi:hypothetical protein
MKPVRILGVLLGLATAWATSGLSAEVLVDQVDAPEVQLYDVVDRILPNGAFNVVTYAAPRSIKVSALGLREAGLRGGPVFRAADEIRIFASREQMNASPKARLWLNTKENAWWFHTGGTGSAEAYELLAGEVLVLVTRASTVPITWVNPLR